MLAFILFSSIVLFTDAIIVHDREGKINPFYSVVLLPVSFNSLSFSLIFSVDYTIRKRLYDTSQEKERQDENPRAGELNFHEVDAFGDDFVDFGAQTGPYGAFTWHANFPVEEQR